MTGTHPDSEEALENATLALFAKLGWETVNAYDEVYGETQSAGTGGPYLGRATRNEVILRPRLEAALANLNPDLPPEALHQAVEQLTRDRSAMTLVHANREIYALLKDGIPVTYRDTDGEERVERVTVIDWANPAHNDFLMVQQFWVTGDIYTRRADLVGFINGLPLLFGELKAHHKRLKHATDGTSATTRTPFLIFSGTTPSSFSPTAATAASVPSPPNGSTLAHGRRSTARARKASFLWIR